MNMGDLKLPEITGYVCMVILGSNLDEDFLFLQPSDLITQEASEGIDRKRDIAVSGSSIFTYIIYTL